MKRIILLLSTNLILIGAISFASLGQASGLSLTMPLRTVAAGSAAANEACQGVNLLSSGGCGDNGQQLSNVLHTIINIFSAVVGIVAVIMIIVAGLQFITSNGNPQNVSKARTSLIYALIGIVVVVLAQTIVHFVFDQVTKAT